MKTIFIFLLLLAVGCGAPEETFPLAETLPGQVEIPDVDTQLLTIIEVLECKLKATIFGTRTSCDVILSNGERRWIPFRAKVGDEVELSL